MNECNLIDEGLIAYELAWIKQKQLFNESITLKLANKKPKHHLIVCEHPHVYTLGKSAEKKNLLLNNNQLKDKNIDLFEIERGGDITYHGPGQLVVYPIFDLEQLGIGVKQFVFNIEQCIINTLSSQGIESERIDGRIGIWLGKETKNERKIAAIGIKCSRHVTMHGLAFNVNTDLSLFNNIIPCGIIDKGVTSIKSELGREISIFDIKKKMIKEFSTIFEVII